mgnify:CR=1 FL=1
MKYIKTYLTGLILFLVFCGMIHAGPIGLSLPDTSATEKDTVSIPVLVDSSMTGEGVVSFQMEITYDASYLEVIELVSAGTMTEAWNEVTFSTTGEGRMALAGAGSTPLEGTGELIYIRFHVKRSGSTYLRFEPETVMLNEGSPEVLTDDGSLSISALPTVTVTPNSALLHSGEQLSFNASGGTSPYTWSVTNDSVASIASDGQLTAEKRGFTRVIASDQTGIADTTDGLIEVRAVRLNLRDTSGWQGGTIQIPLYTSDLSGLNIVSGQITLTYQQNILQATGYETTGTLLEGYGSMAIDTSDEGACSFSFAGSTPLEGSGILLYIHFNISAENTGSTTLDAESGQFNQDIFFTSQTGRFEVDPLPDLAIDPQTAEIRAGSTLQFNVSNGTAPFTWESSDPDVASIDGNGLLTTLKGGIVEVTATDANGATGTTGEIIIYSTELSLPDTSLQKEQSAIMPVYVEDFPAGEGILSCEMELLYDTSRLLIEDVTNTGTLTENWMITHHTKEGILHIATAGTDSVQQAGHLMHLHVYIKPQVGVGESLDLQFQDIALNEGFPMALSHDGTIEVLSAISGKDVGMQYIDYPESACELSDAETVTVSVENTGDETIPAGESIPLSLEVNNEPPIEQSYTLDNDFLPGYILIVDFDQTLDMSVPQDYVLTVYTRLEGDVYAANDTLEKTVSVYGLPQVDLGPDTIVTASFPVLLDAGAGFAAYEWQDGSGGQTYDAQDYGLYWVQVTDENGCTNTDSVRILPAQDLGVTRFYEPVSACELSDTEKVRVRVKNFGPVTLREGDRFNIVLVFNNQEPQLETHTTIRDVPVGDSLNHAFAPRFDFSTPDEYSLLAYTQMTRDVQKENDTSSTVIHVYGFPEVDLGADTIETEDFPVTLDAGAGFALYEWQDGSSGQTHDAQEEGWYWVTVTDENGCSATDSIFVREVVGIFSGEATPGFYIYPNPTMGACRIVFEDPARASGNLEIINVLGKVVYSRQIKSDDAHSMDLDLNALKPGVYVIRLIRGNRSAALRFIHQ